MKNKENKIENTEVLNQNELASIDGGGFWESLEALRGTVQRMLDKLGQD